jgi:dTDP-glucose 4,6-dehydratase
VTAVCSFRHRGKSERITQVLDGHPAWRDRTDVLIHDLTAPFSAQAAARITGEGGLDYLVAYAAESHVDESITGPVPFVTNNVAVTLNTLELARQVKPRAVVLVSTDEVYGPEPATGPHPEWAPILPSNPYSGSKAAAESVAISYWRTYGVPLIIVNCQNLTGERQDSRKYVPMLIRDISCGREVTVHGVQGDIGTRYYLHCRNLADGIVFLLRMREPAAFPAHAAPGAPSADRPDRYNIVGPDRVSNLELAQTIAGILGKPLRYRLEDFHSARPGHDPHYGLDGAKMAGLGWKPPVPFAESLEKTVLWTAAHPEWLMYE